MENFKFNLVYFRIAIIYSICPLSNPEKDHRRSSGTIQINSDVSQNEQLTVGFQGIDSYVILGDVSRGGFNLI